MSCNEADETVNVDGNVNDNAIKTTVSKNSREKKEERKRTKKYKIKKHEEKLKQNKKKERIKHYKHDEGVKKKRGRKPKIKKEESVHPATVAEICTNFNLKDLVIDYNEAVFERVTNFKQFKKQVRPRLEKENAKISKHQLMLLLTAKWQEYSIFKSSKETAEQESNEEVIAPPLPLMLPPSTPPPPLSPLALAKCSEESSASIIVQAAVRKRGRPRKIKPVLEIRSSDRASKRKLQAKAVDSEHDSDFEFEKLLQPDDNNEVVTVAKKMRKCRSKTVNTDIYLCDELPTFIEHSDYCENCEEKDEELILCATCPSAYHLHCLQPKLDKAPNTKWFCAHCVSNGVLADENDEEENDVHQEFCQNCKDVGNLLCCDYCSAAYHISCLQPPLHAIPDGVWKCPRCSCAPLEGKPEKIITWRWAEYDEPACSNQQRSREYFIKWHNKSYWNCSWLSELQMDVHFSFMKRMYQRKHDMQQPPQFDEELDEADSRYKRIQRQLIKFGKATAEKNSESTLDLVNRYYKYGIKPEWLLVQRVIASQTDENGKQVYFVKWRDLGYEKCTWETETAEVPTLKIAIEIYEELRAAFNAMQARKGKRGRKPKLLVLEENGLQSSPSQQHSNAAQQQQQAQQLMVYKHYTAPPTKPITDLKVKYIEQPSFLLKGGLELHAYQIEGINWLRYSWHNGTNTILADEMGLGKTIQTITFLYSLYKEGHCKGPFLVAVPLSTIINWEREFELWAPDFYCVTYIGLKESRAIIRQHELSMKHGANVVDNNKSSHMRKNCFKFNVLLTSFEIISMDADCLGSIEWSVLVVDEAHRLKNNQSKFFRVLSRYHIQYRLLLTGTPLQNNLEELFHLLHFLNRRKFNSLTDFHNEFADVAKEEQVKRLHEMLAPHMLRRLKTDVLKNMPAKSEFIVRVELSAMQKRFYKLILTRNYKALNAKTRSNSCSLINIMMELKKCCNHPYLFPAGAEKAVIVAGGLYEYESMVKAAGKLQLLEKMLKQLREQGHRVLIFSQMTKMLDILEDFLEGAGYSYERIDGSITGNLRQEAIDRFNAPDAQQFIFLLSTRAGGLGINLATADTVIIYDSDWNPHNDIQAFSRAHRIGQVNKVMIYRFVTRDSVEERITQVAKRKMMLTHLVVHPGMGGSKAVSFTKEEMDDILRFGTEQLFKEGDTEEAAIHYDDKAVAELLDRSNRGIEEKESWSNEYLSSFKVASYATKEEQNDEEIELAEPAAMAVTNEASYWSKLLHHHHEQQLEDEDNTFGKGKRRRKQVNYIDGTLKGRSAETSDAKNKEEDDFSDDNSIYSNATDDNDADAEYAADRQHGDDVRKSKRVESILPPLLARVNGHVEVLGFSGRQRKSFLNAIMRYGLPPDNAYTSQWLLRDLRAKSENVFKAYTNLFMRHMCEVDVGNAPTYADGVPREGVTRQHILMRIAIMSLLRNKMQEFEHFNGDCSMPLNVETQTAATSSTGAIKRKFAFNICDGGYTDLHGYWKNEERAAVPGNVFQIWHRRHDYWLLAGVVTHGYGRWQDIQNDQRFSIINEPFKLDVGKGNFLEIKNKFLARRFKLIEQAIVIEEQLNRAMMNNCVHDETHEAMNLKSHYFKFRSMAQTHALMCEEALKGNDAAKAVLHKVLLELEAVNMDLKFDIMHLPNTLVRLPSIAKRLNMSENDILSRLIEVDALQQISDVPDANLDNNNSNA